MGGFGFFPLSLLFCLLFIDCFKDMPNWNQLLDFFLSLQVQCINLITPTTFSGRIPQM